MSVPKLRFKEFEGDWTSQKLGNACKRIMDGTHFSPQSKEGTRKYLTSKNIRNTGLDFSNLSYISEEDHQQIFKRCPVKFGDVLLTKDGAGTGNSCLNTLREDFSLLSSVAVLDGKAEILRNDFLLILLQSDQGMRIIKSVIAGQAITRITLEKIKSFTFNIPPLLEQTKIANFLTTIDDYINQLTRKHALLTQYKKAVMQQIFSQQLRFKDENGEDFVDWEGRSFSEFGDIVTGKTPSTSDSGYWNGEVMFVTPTDMNGSKYQKESQRTLKLQPKMRFLPKDSIMFTCIASIGKMSISTAPTVTNQQINSIIPNGKFNSDFLYYAIFYMSDFIKSTKSSSTLPIINKTEFSKFNILIPSSKKEQTKIANFLAKLDQQLDQLQQQINHVKQYKQGLLQQMFV